MPGIHTYWIPEPNSWESRSDNKADKIIDSLDATAALHLAQRAAASEAQIIAQEQFQLDQKTFLNMYPSYVDSDRNAHMMKHHWENALGVVYPTLEQLEESFFALRDSGVLQLNAKQVAKQDEEAILRRAVQLREQRAARAFNESEAYELPFEELERRARSGWLTMGHLFLIDHQGLPIVETPTPSPGVGTLEQSTLNEIAAEEARGASTVNKKEGQ